MTQILIDRSDDELARRDCDDRFGVEDVERFVADLAADVEEGAAVGEVPLVDASFSSVLFDVGGKYEEGE